MRRDRDWRAVLLGSARIPAGRPGQLRADRNRSGPAPGIGLRRMGQHLRNHARRRTAVLGEQRAGSGRGWHDPLRRRAEAACGPLSQRRSELRDRLCGRSDRRRVVLGTKQCRAAWERRLRRGESRPPTPGPHPSEAGRLHRPHHRRPRNGMRSGDDRRSLLLGSRAGARQQGGSRGLLGQLAHGLRSVPPLPETRSVGLKRADHRSPQ